jgi:hypothetical protein
MKKRLLTFAADVCYRTSVWFDDVADRFKCLEFWFAERVHEMENL